MLLVLLLALVLAFVVLGGPRRLTGGSARPRDRMGSQRDGGASRWPTRPGIATRTAARVQGRAAATLAPFERPSPLLAPAATSTAVRSPLPATRPDLEFGRTYTRREIHTLLGGGGLQDYLPHVGGRVVCGCFNPKLNPHAPFVILPGHGPDIQRWAYVFASQDEPVPCFLKRAGNLWEYVGDYRVRTLSEDPDEIAEWSRLADRDDDVSMILHLEAGAAAPADSPP